MKTNPNAHTKAPLKQTIADFIEQKQMRLRKARQRSSLFFAIGLVISLALVIAAFEWKTYDNGALMDLGDAKIDDMEVLDIPVTEIPPPPPPSQKLITPDFQEVDDQELIEELELVVDIEMTENMEVAELQEFEVEDIEEEKSSEIFTIVESPPTPVGGLEAFYAFIAENLRYPASTMRLNLEGRTYVQFVVEKNGKLTDLLVVKGFHEATNEEALRVLRLSPKWNPGNNVEDLFGFAM